MKRNIIVRLAVTIMAYGVVMNVVMAAGEDEAGILGKLKDDPAGSIQTALSSPSESVATAAFGEYLRGEPDLTAAPAIANIAKFSKKRDMFFKTALLVLLEGNAGGIASKMVEKGGADNTAIGAAIMATVGLSSQMANELNAML